MTDLETAVTEAVDTWDGDHIVTKTAAASLIDHLLSHLTPVLEEIDRNARAYGWEVATTGEFAATFASGPENPFMDPNWRDKVTA